MKAGPLARVFRSPAFWGWLALSSLPPDLVCRAFGLSLADPAYLGVALAWWPADCLGRLAALRLLLRGTPPAAGQDAARVWRSPWTALPSALAAELLVSLRFAVLALAGLIPALALFSLLEPRQLAQPGFLLALGDLAAAGMLPAAVYVLRRMLAPVELLDRPLTAREALDASRERLRGRLGTFLRLAWPWLALSWALDLGGLALPDAVALALGLPSLAVALIPLVLAKDL